MVDRIVVPDINWLSGVEKVNREILSKLSSQIRRNSVSLLIVNNNYDYYAINRTKKRYPTTLIYISPQEPEIVLELDYGAETIRVYIHESLDRARKVAPYLGTLVEELSEALGMVYEVMVYSSAENIEVDGEVLSYQELMNLLRIGDDKDPIRLEQITEPPPVVEKVFRAVRYIARACGQRSIQGIDREALKAVIHTFYGLGKNPVVAKELVMTLGRPGVGKTVLFKMLIPRVVRRRVLTVSGDFSPHDLSKKLFDILSEAGKIPPMEILLVKEGSLYTSVMELPSGETEISINLSLLRTVYGDDIEDIILSNLPGEWEKKIRYEEIDVRQVSGASLDWESLLSRRVELRVKAKTLERMVFWGGDMALVDEMSTTRTLGINSIKEFITRKTSLHEYPRVVATTDNPENLIKFAKKEYEAVLDRGSIYLFTGMIVKSLKPDELPREDEVLTLEELRDFSRYVDELINLYSRTTLGLIANYFTNLITTGYTKSSDGSVIHAFGLCSYTDRADTRSYTKDMALRVKTKSRRATVFTVYGKRAERQFIQQVVFSMLLHGRNRPTLGDVASALTTFVNTRVWLEDEMDISSQIQLKTAVIQGILSAMTRYIRDVDRIRLVVEDLEKTGEIVSVADLDIREDPESIAIIHTAIEKYIEKHGIDDTIRKLAGRNTTSAKIARGLLGATQQYGDMDIPLNLSLETSPRKSMGSGGEDRGAPRSM